MVLSVCAISSLFSARATYSFRVQCRHNDGRAWRRLPKWYRSRGKGQNDIAFVAGGQNQLGYQLFRLLGGMGRVFGHRPERDGNVRPQIGRRSQPVFSPFNFFVFLPVFGNAVAVFVRGENRALQLNGIQIESVFGRFGKNQTSSIQFFQLLPELRPFPVPK